MSLKGKDITTSIPPDDLHEADTPISEDQPDVEHEHDVEAAISVPDSGEASEGGNLKMIVQLLKKCLGVKDLAAMRLSLPASLLEPVPNLEYWQYLDRPDLFAAINDSDDPFERMLAVIRFTLTKDLKFIRGKVVKPYNSVLGEHFRAHWDVLPVIYSSDPFSAPVHQQHTTSPSPTANSSKVFGKGPKDESVASFQSGKSAKSSKRSSSLFDYAATRVASLSSPSGSNNNVSPKQQPSSPTRTNKSGTGDIESNLAARVSNLSLGGRTSGSATGDTDSTEISGEQERVRIAFLTEQVSHHPPISAYYATCPARGVELKGIDQISARVSGTGVRVAPGSYNKGIFVHITDGPGKGEQYQVTHPVATVNGLLRGSFYVTVGESTIITCTGIDSQVDGKERLRAIIEYKEESWIGSPKFAIEGVIHTYSEGDTAHEEWTKVKHVPVSTIVAYFDGSWRTRVRWRRAPSARPFSSSTSLPDGEHATLIDLSTLLIVPKQVRPLHKQHAYESRKLWDSVTSKLLNKEYSEATKHKHTIEQRQRDKAAERKRKGEEFVPVYFEKNIDSGIPKLTLEGLKTIEEEVRTTEGEL